jgi:hypothetical protein
MIMFTPVKNVELTNGVDTGFQSLNAKNVKLTSAMKLIVARSVSIDVRNVFWWTCT